MTINRRRFIFASSALVIPAVVGTLVLTSIGNANSDQDMAPIQYADAVDAPPPPSGRSREAVLADVLARTNAPGLVSARFTPADSSANSDEPGGATSADGTNVLSLTVETDGTVPGSVRPAWVAEMIGGVVSDELAREGKGRLSSIRLLAKLPNGTVVELGSGIGNVVAGQRFSGESQQAISRRLRANAEQLGLRVVSISFVTPRQAAPALVVETSDPASFVKSLESPTTWSALLGKHRNYEGWYLEVRDTTGAPIVVSSSAHRAGVAQSWTRPDLERRHTVFDYGS